MKRLILLRAVTAAFGLMLLSGCNREGEFSPVDMWNRSRFKPYEETQFFADRSSSRPIPLNTVARGQLRTDEPYYYGTNGGRYIAGFPAQVKVNAELLQRGQERYQVFCQMCHGEAGYGDGMIVKRGFSPPPSYHIARLRTAPEGHYYDVITNGYGAMYSYANRVPVQDRWAIVAYIRALQRSQANVALKDQGALGKRNLSGTAQRRDLGQGENPSADAGPNETTQQSPVPAIIGPNNVPGNAENQKAG